MSDEQVIPPSLKAIATEVCQLLKERNETISVAETAAGGLISAALLSTAGASKVYKGGLTLYTLPSRMKFAGWQQSDTDQYRGPTPEVVASFTENVRSKLESTYCIGESGTAGPTGGNTPNRTPGYVALAVSSERGTEKKELDTGKGVNREQNMLAFGIEALKFLKEVIQKQSKI